MFPLWGAGVLYFGVRSISSSTVVDWVELVLVIIAVPQEKKNSNNTSVFQAILILLLTPHLLRIMYELIINVLLLFVYSYFILFSFDQIWINLPFISDKMYKQRRNSNKNSSAYFSLIIFEWLVLDLKKNTTKSKKKKIKQAFS